MQWPVDVNSMRIGYTITKNDGWKEKQEKGNKLSKGKDFDPWILCNTKWNGFDSKWMYDDNQIDNKPHWRDETNCYGDWRGVRFCW